ncbi:MAG: pseudouridine-5'-phosphate glycosidase [Actinomycetales bacterium]
MSGHSRVVCSTAVREALRDGRPVVALESTIISHGMPYPDNIAMAREVEQIVRDGGAVPATIAVLDGVARVGLSESELEVLASRPDVLKVSLRDLPYVMAKGLHGATTVAATMRVALLAGITVFVTGGLGGVHKGAASSMDISADLTELARTNMAVVSSGVKSILDIGLTLERLETLGVPVVVYRSSQFPSFYSRQSGFAAPMRLDSPAEIVALMSAKWDLGLRGAVCVANPVPEPDEIPAADMAGVIQEALDECARRGVSGKDVTPYLLSRIVDLTGGASLRANIALVRSNAALGARLAGEWAAGATSGSPRP